MTVSVCLPLPRDGQYQTNWDYILSSFPPDALYVIGDEDDAPGTNVFSKLEATYIADASGLPDGPKMIVLAPDNGRYVQGVESLEPFEHPLEAIYFFGHDTRWVDDEVLGGKRVDHYVYIDTATDDDLWSWQSYAIVAWDRAHAGKVPSG